MTTGCSVSRGDKNTFNIEESCGRNNSDKYE